MGKRGIAESARVSGFFHGNFAGANPAANVNKTKLLLFKVSIPLLIAVFLMLLYIDNRQDNVYIYLRYTLSLPIYSEIKVLIQMNTALSWSISASLISLQPRATAQSMALILQRILEI